MSIRAIYRVIKPTRVINAAKYGDEDAMTNSNCFKSIMSFSQQFLLYRIQITTNGDQEALQSYEGPTRPLELAFMCPKRYDA